MSRDFRRVMRVSSVGLMVCAFAPMSVLAQQIVKWTDANGQVHYSDHAPPSLSSEVVAVPQAPRSATSPPPPSVPAGEPESELDPAIQRAQEEDERARARDRDRLAQQEASKKQREEQQKKYEQEVVARCKARHETYCNEGAKGIEKEEWLRAVRQRQAAQRVYEDALLRGDPNARRPR